MQSDKGFCYLCKLLNGDDFPKQTQEHHVCFGTANRKQSEKYGLKVYLCLNHHEIGPAAVHNNHENARILQREAQKVFEKNFPDKSFIEIFGRNYNTGEES